MNRITSALKRKWGPLPAWLWILGGFLLVYFYRKYSSTTATGTGTGSVAPTPATPQPQTVLQPGESVYDPNTGALTTAPGGGSDTGSPDPLAQALEDLAKALAAGTPPGQTGSGGNTPSGGKKKNRHGGKTVRGPRIGGRGWGTSFGGLKGKTHGGKAKPKGQENAKGKTSKHTPAGHTTRPRSGASARSKTGGRTSRASGSTGYSRNLVGRATAPSTEPSRARQRPRTPAITTVVSQRRPAQTPRQSPNRQAGGVAPRPSAPPPRTVRSPSRATATPKSRKR